MRKISQANRITVIIFGQSSSKELLACLASLHNQTFKEFCVVITSNSITSEATELIQRDYPAVKIFKKGEGHGPVELINDVIKAANSDYIAIVSSDSTLDKHWLFAMQSAMELDKSLGSCASRIVLADCPKIISSCGMAFKKSLNSCVQTIGWGYPNDAEFHQKRLVLSAFAGAAFYRSKALRDAGLFDQYLDPDDSFYYPSFDLGLRMQLRGYDCLFNSEAVAYRNDQWINYGIPSSFHKANRHNSFRITLACLPIGFLILLLPPYSILQSYRLFRSSIALRPSKWKENPKRIRNSFKIVRQLLNPQIREKRKSVQVNRELGLSQFSDRLFKLSREYEFSENHNEFRSAHENQHNKMHAENSDKCRVALISNSWTLDGTEKCLLWQASSLKQIGFDPLAIVPGPGKLVVALMKADVSVKIVPYRWWVGIQKLSVRQFLSFFLHLISDTKKIAQILQNSNIEIVETASSVVLQGALAAKMIGARHIWHVREYYPNKSLKPFFGQRIMLRLIESLSDKIVAPSKAVAGLFNGSNKVYVIPESIDAEFFLPGKVDKQILRQSLNISRDSLIALNIGAVYPGKDQLTAVRAIAQLLSDGIDIHLLLCGDENKEYKEMLVNEIRIKGIESNVHFLGYRYDIAEILDASDFLLVTSLRESFGLTIVEAMARQVPVISTKCGGPEELLEDGITGCLVEIADYNAIAGKIKEMIDNSCFRASIIENANVYVLAFKPSQVLGALQGLYRDVCG